jgi:hypothetical protein
MLTERLVQTRIPGEVAEQVDSLAAGEGLSVAAWLRRLILKEINSMYTEAWTAEKPVIASQDGPASYYLKRVKDLSATEVEFALIHGPAHDRRGNVTPGYLSDVNWYRNPDDYRFFLSGSPMPWSIVRLMHNTTAEEMLIVLRQEMTETTARGRTLSKLEGLAQKLHVDDLMIDTARSAIKKNNYLESDFGFSLREVRNIPLQEGFYQDSFAIEVTYLPTGRSRTYIEDQGSSWVFEFEVDLSNRSFEGIGFRFKCERCSYVWEALQNSGHAICPVCKTQSAGEPEIWDGRKWKH